MYAFSLTFDEPIVRFLIRNPDILFALAQMLLMCLSYRMLLWMVRPRYLDLEEEMVSSVCPWKM